MSNGTNEILALILAGGQGRRMAGASKPLLRLGGMRLIDRVVATAREQAAAIALNLHDNTAQDFADLGLKIIADALPGRLGPLAGVLAGLEHAARHSPEISHVLSLPCDCPFLPKNLATRLAAAGDFACAASGGRTHPVIALWPIGLRHELRKALEAGERAVGPFQARHGVKIIEWTTPPDPFFNVNTPDDLLRAEQILRTEV